MVPPDMACVTRAGRWREELPSPGLKVTSETFTLSFSSTCLMVPSLTAFDFSCAIAGVAITPAIKNAGTSSPASTPANLLMVYPLASRRGGEIARGAHRSPQEEPGTPQRRHQRAGKHEPPGGRDVQAARRAELHRGPLQGRRTVDGRSDERRGRFSVRGRPARRAADPGREGARARGDHANAARGFPRLARDERHPARPGGR